MWKVVLHRGEDVSHHQRKRWILTWVGAK
uniref:Uncharacterized protein n=1 Tax=Anguilla anguilla TaxID=7936 RepID=A0A0E9U8T6_ANGAN